MLCVRHLAAWADRPFRTIESAEKQKSLRMMRRLFWREISRQRPTLPPSCPGSTIGAGGLNFRVRNGNGCDPSAIATGKLVTYSKAIARAFRPRSLAPTPP